MTVKRSKLKPEVVFQYGGRLFWGTGSSNISAMDWGIWPKFVMLLGLSLLICQAWPNQKPQLDLRCHNRHLVKSIWRHNFVGDYRIWTKFGRLMQNHMPTAVKRSILKPEIEFLYGARLVLGRGSSNISAVDSDIWSKLGMQIVLSLTAWETP